MEEFILTYLFIINCLAFWLYAADKRKAEQGQWRTPEAALFGVAAVGGAYGSLMGMLLFRHKTRKASFGVIIPVLFMLWTAAYVLYALWG